MHSLDDDSVPTKEKIEANGGDENKIQGGDGYFYMDSTPDLNEQNKKYIIQEELDDEDQYNLLAYRSELDDNMDIELNSEIDDYDSNLIDNFWAWALQTPLSSQSKSQMRRTRPKNRRMQMFSYLSQPSKSFLFAYIYLLYEDLIFL